MIEGLDADGKTRLDMLAWPLHAPFEFATATGNIEILGAWNLVRNYGNKPVKVHRNPLVWLQAGCKGIAIIDPQHSGFWIRKYCKSEIIVDDVAHGREILEILQRKQVSKTPLPEFDPRRIRFPQIASAA